MSKIILKSNNKTKEFAAQYAHNLIGGEVLALSGDLGAGKTTFTQGLAEGLGVKDKITSPTFVLMKQYKVTSHQSLVTSLVHIDAYRMQDEMDALSIGLTDYFNKPDTVTVIEWPENIIKILPNNTIWINFKHINENTREIVISNKFND